VEGFTERAIFVLDKEGVVRYRDIHAIDQQPDNEEVFKVLRQLGPEAAKKLADTLPEAKPAPHKTRDGVPMAAPSEPEPRPQQAPVKAQQHSIIMYCTPWCPDCRNAKRYLDGRGIKYAEVDISKDKKAEKKARELASGKLVTPTFHIEGQVVLDFDRKRLEEILGKP